VPETSYSFRIGDIECVALRDGSLPYPPQWFFSNIPQNELEEELRAKQLATDHVEGTYTCLLVKTGGKNVLLDTGAGSMVPSTGALPAILRRRA
jgi:hypothetical protein